VHANGGGGALGPRAAVTVIVRGGIPIVALVGASDAIAPSPLQFG